MNTTSTFLTLLTMLVGLLAPITVTPTPQPPETQTRSNPTIVINEVLAHADLPNVDAVELRNLGAAPVDLSGWWLTDDDARPQSDWVRLPDDAIISGYGLYVVANTDGDWSFGLSEAGDAIYLFRPDPITGAPVRVEAMLFGASPRNVSFIRYVDAANIARFPLQEGAPTIGFSNCGVRVSAVQIEELMIDPANGGSEYVVIANVGDAPAPLYNIEHPTIPWKLVGQKSSGKDSDMFIFPELMSLEPGERIILSETTPDAFRQTYAIPASVRILGPLASGLSNTGERVALAEPLEPELDGSVNFAFVDEVAYSYLPPWPSVAENGLALVRIDPTRYANDVANWQAAPALQTITSGRVSVRAEQRNLAPAHSALASGDSALAPQHVYLPVVNAYQCPFR
ncbi:MAG TPA: lamin tail domain-containing protein [Chloroflexi bacterium]|nr:lamin tail domain-containing protein [Chloroflexota bacterium]